jgi:S1-C subfamily serine protease
MRRTIFLVAVLAVITTACSVDLARSDQGAPVGQLSQGGTLAPGDVEGVVTAVLPAVVNVTTDVFQTDSFGNAQQGQGVGTGFIVRQDGIVVTNCHVVEGASRISVFTSDTEPTRYDARLIGGDCLNDLAVLKIDATGLPTVALGSSEDLRLGQSVVAVGYALALEGGPTVTTGIVSALGRTIQAQDPACEVCENGVRTYTGTIQTDAAINHGNSGGPLVDMAGRVVGINSAGNDGAENIGFAIPIDPTKDVIREAMNEPLAASPYIGVSTTPVTSDMAFQLDITVDQGAYVLATTSDGPAQSAGIAEGDVIIGVDGQAVTSSEDLGRILETLTPGDTVPVEVVGPDGESRTVDVTLGTRPLPTGQIP